MRKNEIGILWMVLLLGLAAPGAAVAQAGLAEGEPAADEPVAGDPSGEEPSGEEPGGEGLARSEATDSGPAVDPPAGAQGAAGGDAPEPGGEAASPAEVRIQHLPVHSVTADEVELVFHVRHPERLGRLLVRHRPLGEGGGGVREVNVRRTGRGWVALIDTADVAWPGFVYWAIERRGETERPVFASAEAPHPVHVMEPEGLAYERRALRRRDGRRSRARLRGDYVQLGTRAVIDSMGDRQELSEHYYLLEASYSYSFFSEVDEIQLALGRMRGNVVHLGSSVDERGIDYGRAAITWRALDLLRFRTGVLFGFSQSGFEVGASGYVIIGQPEGTSLTFGGEGITTLGGTGKVRLGWATLPRIPMGATVEVTTYPAGEDAGVRLLYDVAYELYPGAYARIEGGYRGWNSTTGGLSLGGELALAF